MTGGQRIEEQIKQKIKTYNSHDRAIVIIK